MARVLWGNGASRARSVHWMLHELGLDYEKRLIGSRTGETQTESFLRLNPAGKIPVLQDGDLILTESAAIITYLADTYAPDIGLVPRAYTRARARYNEWASFIQMELDAHTLYVLRKHRDLANLYGEAPAAVQHAIDGFNKQVAVAEMALRERDHLVGDQFTGADLMLSTTLSWAIAYGFDLSPRLREYNDLHRARPAFRSAAELNFSISAGA